MDYNTQRPRLVLPEYGRLVQNMVDYAVGLTDRAQRQALAETIVNVMAGFFPAGRSQPDFRHKLWDHLALMSDYRLDVDGYWNTDWDSGQLTFQQLDLKIGNNTGIPLELDWLGERLLELVNALFALLAALGVVTDPTTEGLGDSERALAYTAPAARQ